ncbi:hypothetical protein ACE1TF_19585 [Geomicrobium sp. JSM 1781026]
MKNNLDHQENDLYKLNFGNEVADRCSSLQGLRATRKTFAER